MPPIQIEVGHGTATGIDPSLTKQLQESVGVVYAPGDPAARKHPGRAVFNATPLAAATVNDVMFVEGGGLMAASGAALYRLSSTGIATNIATLQNSGYNPDIASLNDIGYLVTGAQSDETAPFAALAIRSGADVFRLGLATVFTPPIAQAIAGPGITGTFYYWVTEYDATANHLVESAFEFNPTAGSPGGTAAAQPLNQKVQITLPTARNASATKWRIYRSIDAGLPPIGWLVAEVAIATLTYDDDMSDADLVVNEPYRIVTINGIPENMDEDPQELALDSIASFQGSLVAIPVDADLAFTPAGEPHSWPDSYRLNFPTKFGGTFKCVRSCGDVLYVASNQELFMVNYLPDESDSIFSVGIVSEHVANYGTPSKKGMCSFTGWGGIPVLFIASLQGPIVVAGRSVDRAVRNIDWPTLIPRTLMGLCKAIDNPEKWRVELYYRDSTTDTTSWKCLHFYYDQARVTREVGSLPEMAWTGPHPVPGPGCYALTGGAGLTPATFTAGRNAATGFVYREDNGAVVDAANLTDADGTIPFRLKTAKVYPGGECRADHLDINKFGAGDQDYDVTFTAHRENGNPDTAYLLAVDGQHDGISGISLNASLLAFDVRIVCDGVDAMAPINNITVNFEDQRKALKTTIV